MTDHDFSTFTAPLAHPGEHLREDYLPECGLSPTDLALALGIDEHTIDQILACQHPITPDLATGLAKLFKTSREFWLNLQAQHDSSRLALENSPTDPATDVTDRMMGIEPQRPSLAAKSNSRHCVRAQAMHCKNREPFTKSRYKPKTPTDWCLEK